MPDKPKQIMGIEGLAKYLDVPKSTLYKLAQEGEIPGQKVGKHWRFRQETIDTWLDTGGKPERAADADGPKHGETLSLDPFFSVKERQKLATRWITTSQQILAVAASKEGRSGLAELLGVELAALSATIDQLVEKLPSEEVNRLRKGRQGGELGVILPPGSERLRPPREEQEK